MGQGQRGRGVEAGRGQPPRAPKATTSSPPSGCGRWPKKLEKEPGEGEKRSSISSSSTPPKHRSSGDPGRPPDPGALAHPRLPRAPPRASPNPPERGRSTQAAGSERCRDMPEADREAGERCPPASVPGCYWSIADRYSKETTLFLAGGTTTQHLAAIL